MAHLFNVIGFRMGNSDWINFNEERDERRICDFVTTDCRDCPERKILATSREGQQGVNHGQIMLDHSHADMIVLGKNCAVLSFTGSECDVSPYTDTYDSIKSVPIAKAGTAWTSPEPGSTFILVFSNKGLWMGDKMDHSITGQQKQNPMFGFGQLSSQTDSSTLSWYSVTLTMCSGCLTTQ